MNRQQIQIESLLVHTEFVQRLARELSRDWHRADDVIQETWFAALHRAPLDYGKSPKAWLRKVVINAARQSARQEKTRQRHENQQAATGQPTEHPTVATVRDEITEAVRQLDPRWREVVTLRYFEQLSFKDIADRTGIPVETVRSRLKKAKAVLRERLDRKLGSRQGWCVAALALAKQPVSGSRLPTPERSTHQSMLATGSRLGRGVGWLAISAAGLVLISLLLLVPDSPPPETAIARGTPSEPPATEVSPRTTGQPWRPPVTVSEAVVEAATTAPAPFRYYVGGTVVDSTGQPLAGIPVYLGNPASVATFHSRLEFEQNPPEQLNPRAGLTWRRVVSGPAGEFLFEWDRPPYGWSLGAMDLTHGIGFLRKVSLSPTPTREHTLRLSGGVPVSGRVIDENGEPVAGARVQIVATERCRDLIQRIPRSVGNCDENGHFRLPPVMAGEYFFRAPRLGLTNQLWLGPFSLQGQPLDIVVPARSATVGSVHSPIPVPELLELVRTRLSHKPSLNAFRVSAWEQDPSEANVERGLRAFTVPIEQHGDTLTYAPPTPLEAGQYLSVHAGPMLLATARIKEPGVAPTLSIDHHRLRQLQDVATLRVKVIDAESGAPIPEAGVKYLRSSGQAVKIGEHGIHRNSLVGDPGVIEIPGLGLGSYQVAANCSGYASRTCPVVLEAPGSVVERVIALTPRIHNLVVSLQREDGQPVREARFRLFDAQGSPLELPCSWNAAARSLGANGWGTFVLHGLPEGHVEIEVQPPLYAEDSSCFGVIRPSVLMTGKQRVRWTVPCATPAEFLVQTESMPRYLQLEVWTEQGALVHSDPALGIRTPGNRVSALLGPGKHRARVYAPGYQIAEVEFLTPQRRPVELALQPVSSNVLPLPNAVAPETPSASASDASPSREAKTH